MSVASCGDVPTAPRRYDEQAAADLALAGYKITSLALLPGHTGGSALAINDAGTVIVGYSFVHVNGAGNFPRAVRWTPLGLPVDLGTLPGHDRSEAHDVNDAGQIVGRSLSDDARHAFLYTPGAGMISIHDPLIFEQSEAWGINNAGVVVGAGRTAGGDLRAFRWTATSGVELLEGFHDSHAFDINEHGEIVGHADVLGNFHDDPLNWQAVAWSDAGVFTIGTLGGAFSRASGINDDGAVVGTSSTMMVGLEPYHGFIYWMGGVNMDLGPYSASYTVKSISNSGRIVGQDIVTTRAITIYNNTLTKLPNLPHGSAAGAWKASSCGTIVGEAQDENGVRRAVRWDNVARDCRATIDSRRISR